MTTLRDAGSVLFIRRMRLSNQERVDQPMSETEALAIAGDSRVTFDFRVLSLHRLMDIARPLTGECRDKLWGKIGATIQRDFDEETIPFQVMKRFKEQVPFAGMRDWAYHSLRRRAVAVQQQDRIAA
jgi:hypothetical protein